jgi:hypothetical protein
MCTYTHKHRQLYATLSYWRKRIKSKEEEEEEEEEQAEVEAEEEVCRLSL